MLQRSRIYILVFLYWEMAVAAHLISCWHTKYLRRSGKVHRIGDRIFPR